MTDVDVVLLVVVELGGTVLDVMDVVDVFDVELLELLVVDVGGGTVVVGPAVVTSTLTALRQPSGAVGFHAAGNACPVVPPFCQRFVPVAPFARLQPASSPICVVLLSVIQAGRSGVPAATAPQPARGTVRKAFGVADVIRPDSQSRVSVPSVFRR